MKKFISCILVMVMTISIFGTLPTNAENGSLEPNSQMETDVSIQGTNTFGNLLTSELTAEMDKQEENSGCNIFSIEMNGTDAAISFETTENCTLVVGIYDESGQRMLASGNTAVTKGETEALVTIETNSMPQYYYLRGFLVDSDTLRPVCTVYESPNYTQEMQEFFAKTVDDFDSEKVLNLDEDKSNNFAVFSDTTVMIEQNGTTNRVIQADDNTRTYVIANADSIVKSLKNGDVFTCENGSETLIVKVDKISVNGSTVKITGQDTSMEEVFEYVKIDTDKTELNSSRTYQQKNAKSRAVSFEGSGSSTVLETSFLPAVDGLSGTLKMTVSASLKLYLSIKYQYVEMKMGYEAKLAIALEQKKTVPLPLPEMTIPTPVGVNISVTPSLEISVGGKVEINGTLSGHFGFAYDSDEGKARNITSAPTFDSVLKLEVDASIVLSLKPNVNFIDDKIVGVYLEGKVGVYATSEKILWQLNKDESVRHECKLCFDGETNFKANTGFGVELCGRKILDRGMFEQRHKLNDFYYSIDRDEHGLGACPYKQYRVNVRAIDTNNNPISEASIIKNDPIGDIFLGKTDSNGNLEIWLPSGEHTLTAKKDDVKNTRDITVRDRAKSVVMALNVSENSKKYTWHLEPTIEAEDVIVSDDSIYTIFDSLKASDIYSIIKKNGKFTMIDYDGQKVTEELYDRYYFADAGEIGLWRNDISPYSLMAWGDEISKDDYGMARGETGGYNGFYYERTDNTIYADRFFDIEIYDGLIQGPENKEVKRAVLIEEANVTADDYNIEHKSKYGIAFDNNITVDTIYNDGRMSLYNDMIVLKNGDKWGYFNGQTGEQIIDFKCNDVSCNKYTTSWDYDENGVMIEKTHKTYPYAFSDGYVALYTDDGCGYYDTQGNEVIPCGTFEEVRPVHNGLAWVKKDGKWGVIELENNQQKIIADDLVNKTLPDIIKMMSGTYEITTGTTDDIIYVSNQSIIPGMQFKIEIDCFRSYDENGLNEQQVRNDIEQGIYSLNAIKVSDNAYATSELSANMSYEECCSILGSNLKCNIGTIGSGAPDSECYTFKKDNTQIELHFDIVSELISNGGTFSYEDMIKYNPNLNCIILKCKDTVETIEQENSPKSSGSSFCDIIMEQYSNVTKEGDSIGLIDSYYATPLNLKQSPTPLANEEDDTSSITGVSVFYSNLNPNEIYNFYLVKSETTDNILSNNNLLHISQIIPNADGEIEIQYITKEKYLHEKRIIKPASKIDLSSAQVTIPDILCNGTEQFAEPEVTLNGEILTEGIDYDIEKRYSAIYPGKYELIITGIRNYTGEIAATYNVYCEHNFENTKCTICKSLKDTVGDANGDGVVGVADLVVLQDFLIVRRKNISINADVNQDGVINAFDLCLLRKIVSDAIS